MHENGNGKPVGCLARAGEMTHAAAWLRSSRRANRGFILLFFVVTLTIVALGWWVDQYIAIGTGNISGEDAAPSRAPPVVALGLAWTVILGAILLVFRHRDPTLPFEPIAEPQADQNDLRLPTGWLLSEQALQNMQCQLGIAADNSQNQCSVLSPKPPTGSRVCGNDRTCLARVGQIFSGQ